MSDKNLIGAFTLPYTYLLDDDPEPVRGVNRERFDVIANLLEKSLKDLGLDGKIIKYKSGPVVTMYDYALAQGVSFKAVFDLSDDLLIAFVGLPVRFVLPTSSRDVVGIEVPNPERETVGLKALLESDEFQTSKKKLPLAMGKDVFGNIIVSSLVTTPHMLLAGATGTGKSSFIHSLVLSLLYTSSPEDVKLLLVDPKMLEFSIYDGLPHLLLPVLTDPKKASQALQGVVREMERRYALMAAKGVRNVEDYNQKLAKEEKSHKKVSQEESVSSEELANSGTPLKHCHLYHLVVIVDELADLMMVARREVDESVARLAAMARAAGIHLVLATQRPSTDVLTGLIRANIPTRVSFKVFSRQDSRLILEQKGAGAESLLGQGDMLFLPPDGKIKRVHGAYVSEAEVQRVVDFLKGQSSPEYDKALLEPPAEVEGNSNTEDEFDEKWDDALAIIADTRHASISMLQRRLRIGYNRAARMIEKLEAEGIVGPSDGTSRPREVFNKQHQSNEIEETEGSKKVLCPLGIDRKTWGKAVKLNKDIEVAFAQYLQIKLGICKKDAQVITKEMISEGLLRLGSSD